MGNGSHHHQLHQQSFYTKNAFLPLLCRVSIKDVKLREYKDHSSAPFFDDDPSSPKVSCVGQVKKTNRFIGFTTPYRLKPATTAASCTTTTTTAPAATSTSNTSSCHLKYTKLTRLFSGKSLLNYAYNGSSSRMCGDIIIRRNGSRRSSKINIDGGESNYHYNNGNHAVSLTISELDPPLPVIKKVQQPSDQVNLWMRRSGGLALKTLQIEQMHLPKNYNYLPATTV